MHALFCVTVRGIYGLGRRKVSKFCPACFSASLLRTVARRREFPLGLQKMTTAAPVKKRAIFSVICANSRQFPPFFVRIRPVFAASTARLQFAAKRRKAFRPSRGTRPRRRKLSLFQGKKARQAIPRPSRVSRETKQEQFPRCKSRFRRAAFTFHFFACVNSGTGNGAMAILANLNATF